MRERFFNFCRYLKDPSLTGEDWLVFFTQVFLGSTNEVLGWRNGRGPW